MNKFSSTFGQVLQIFSKKEFYLAVRETQSERGAKGVFLMEPVRGHALLSVGPGSFPAGISEGLASCLGKLKHLGIDRAPSLHPLLCQ
jgi:hypothetical protein